MSEPLREQFARALEARGERLVKKTSKSWVYTRQAGGYYYLGAAGSFRFGDTKVGSIPCGHRFKIAILLLAAK